MRTSTTWQGHLVAMSSIAHDGERRGTVALLRREALVLDGELVYVPVISGNSLRGSLRRVAANLFTDALELDGELTLPAAQLLRGGGGALHKSSKAPLTGEPLRRLRTLVPPVAAFGGTVSARTISGALQVGKVWPHVAETAHLTGATGAPTMFEATALETYTRAGGDSRVGDLVRVPLRPDGTVDDTTLRDEADAPMLYRVETFPAGTAFSAWVRLERADALTSAFVADVIDTWSTLGRLGGRAGTGHGQVRCSWDVTATLAPAPACDWRAHLLERRADVLAVLATLN